MKISIITIAYNSEKEIERTIQSVLNQTYTNLEYIIIDGASKDKTVEIAESYREKLENQGVTFRVYSEPDKGIYDAMNKGIRKATGEVIGLLNSGDWYEVDTAEAVADAFGDSTVDLIYANIRMHKTNGSSFVKKSKQAKIETSRNWNHPTMFVRANIYKENPFRCEGIHDDYGCFLQMKKKGVTIKIVDKVLANFEMGGVSNQKGLKSAVSRIRDRYIWCYRINGYSRWYMVECVAIEVVKMILG